MSFKTWMPFIHNADGSVAGHTAGATPDDLAQIAREYRRDNPQAFLSPLMKGSEVSDLTGCASWAEMQQRGLQNVGFPQPAMQRLIYDEKTRQWIAPPEAYHRHEVMSWLDKVLPVAEHYLRRQKKLR